MRTPLWMIVGLAIAACDAKGKTDNAEAPAPVATTTAAVATGEADPAAAAAKEAPPSPAVGAAPAEAAGSQVVATTDAGLVVSGNGKTAVFSADGGARSINLQNQQGKGSVTTTPTGGMTVQGKSGKTIVIPPVPGR